VPFPGIHGKAPCMNLTLIHITMHTYKPTSHKELDISIHIRYKHPEVRKEMITSSQMDSSQRHYKFSAMNGCATRLRHQVQACLRHNICKPTSTRASSMQVYIN
jgi:hypothetical protein